jgi:ankyrin repeat protein
MYTAALASSLDVVSLLVDCGADIEAKDSSGRTPLCSAGLWNSSLDIAQLLVERGAKTENIDLSWMN